MEVGEGGQGGVLVAVTRGSDVLHNICFCNREKWYFPWVHDPPSLNHVSGGWTEPNSLVLAGVDPGFWSGGPNCAKNRGFSFKSAWKLHDFEQNLEPRGGARPPGTPGSAGALNILFIWFYLERCFREFGSYHEIHAQWVLFFRGMVMEVAFMERAWYLWVSLHMACDAVVSTSKGWWSLGMTKSLKDFQHCQFNRLNRDNHVFSWEKNLKNLKESKPKLTTFATVITDTSALHSGGQVQVYVTSSQG